MTNDPVRRGSLSREAKRELLAQLLRERSSEEPIYPLSYGQRALWLLNQVAPESAAYNVALSATIRSPLDVAALRRAFEALLQRHEVLRSTFEKRGDTLVQRVHSALEVVFEEADASDWTPQELSRRVEETYRRPFDLARGPAWRVGLFHRGVAEHAVLLTMHHIACDGWSIGIVLKDWLSLYASERAGTSPTLAPLPQRYADFVRWQDQMLKGQHGEEMWDYWQRQLAGPLPVLELPTDHPRPPSPTFRGATTWFRIESAMAESLRKLARDQGATLYVVLIAAFQVLLHRYSGQEDILVGSPTAGRSRSEFENLVGFFVNPVVLRANLAGDPTFAEYLGRVRQVVIDALKHADYPFPLLVQRLQPHRDLSRSPVFQVDFNLLKLSQLNFANTVDGREDGGRFSLGELTVEPFAMAQQEGQFDVALNLTDTGRTLLGSLRYRTDLFEAGTIARMVGHLQTLLAGVVQDPGQRLSALPLLTAEERGQICEWNRTTAPYPHDKTIHTLFERQVEQTPNAIAVTYEDRHLTFGELNARANQVARRLRQLGVRPETLVGLCVDRSPEMIVGLLGILKAGGAYVPLDPRYPPHRLAHMMADSRATVLITASASGERVAVSDGRAIAERLRSELEGTWSLVDLCADQDVLRDLPANNLKNGVQPDNLAYVIYTSGSTGRPKGVMVSHRSVLNLASALVRAVYDNFPGEQLRIGLNAPLSFDASVKQIVMMIYGHTLDILPSDVRLDGRSLIEYIRRHRIDGLDCVPSQLKLLLACGFLDGGGWIPRCVLSGGEAIDDATWRVFAAAPVTQLFNVYGPTECTVDATAANARMVPERVTIGKPLANVRTYILDKNGQLVPIGVRGELHIGGAGVGRGYLNQPDLTAEKFVADPFIGVAGVPETGVVEARLYKTGDQARYRPDGNIELLGRMDQQVKLRGFRIELGEIEAVLTAHPCVQAAVAHVREGGAIESALIAYVVYRPGQAQTTSDIQRYLKQRLPEYMVPSAVVPLDRIPLMPNGKVDRDALPDTSSRSERAVQRLTAPSTAAEKVLAGIWRDVLRVEQVGVDDDFFDLGGHSLLVMQVLSRVDRDFGVGVPIRHFFESPTIRALATHLESRSTAGSVQHATKATPGAGRAAAGSVDTAERDEIEI